MTNQIEKVKNAVTKTKLMPLKDVVMNSMPKMLKVAPKHIDAVRFGSLCESLMKRNPDLMKCDPFTVMASFYTCLSLGLEPIDGQAYILPFKNKGIMEAQFMVGYKGLVQLYYRHQDSSTLDWNTVRENDKFEYEKGTNSFLRFRKAEGDRGNVKGYYIVAKLKDGNCIFDYMTHKECIEHGKKYSKTWDREKGEFGYYSPWRTSEEQMCLKTVCRNLMKILPKSVEMQRALEVDETIRKITPKQIEEKADILDVEDRTDWETLEAPKEEEPIEVKPTKVKKEAKKEKDEKVEVQTSSFSPSSSALKNTPEKTLREEVTIMISELLPDDKKDSKSAEEFLRSVTAFNDYRGVSLPSGLSAVSKEGKRTQLEVTHSKLKKAWEEKFVPEVNVDGE